MFDGSIIAKMIKEPEARGRELCSMFFRRGNALEYIKAGSTFRRTHRDRMVETAEVLSVATDSFGIPHVRFSLRFKRPDRNEVTEGPRMLALKTFAELYSERCAV
jgi:hypothetical protein